MSSAATLKAVRLLHHYSGVFIAPAVLFFAFTGFLQTFSFHESSHAPGYVPPAIFAQLAQLHKNANITVQAPKPPSPPNASAPKPAAPVGPPRPPKWQQHLPMKLFFGAVAIGLMLSTFTGAFMAWKYNRNKLAVALTFLAGIAIPALLLLF
jgi:hypothetical protein